MNTKNPARALISLWIIFHLMCISLVPNRMGAFYQWLSPLMDPYVNFLEFSASWNFFAPEAGAAPLGFEWEYLDQQQEPVGRGRFPEFPDTFPYYQRERHNRRVTLGRFMAMDDNRAEKMLGFYACAQNPKAYSLRLWKILYSIPSVQDVRDGKTHIGEFVEKDRRMVSHVFCDESDAQKRGAK